MVDVTVPLESRPLFLLRVTIGLSDEFPELL